MTFPGKVLLFGEYTVILGGDALAVPSTTFHGGWGQVKRPDPRLKELLSGIREHAAGWIDVKALEKDAKAGWTFESNIPEGYGLGSSGAFTAGLLARYGLSSPADNEDARKALAGIENLFHGQSSGLDPLISYFQKPVYRKAGNNIFLDLPVATDAFYLLDSGRGRATAPLVATFRSKMEDDSFTLRVKEDWAPHVEQAIEALLERRTVALDIHMKKISRFCLDFMSEMIPENVIEMWRNGLESGDYTMKLCGAGGGGMFLVHTHSEDVVRELKLQPL